MLKPSKDLPKFVLDLSTPKGLVLAADHKPKDLHDLTGDIEALQFVDLEREGLGEYKSYLERLVGNQTSNSHSNSGNHQSSIHHKHSNSNSHRNQSAAQSDSTIEEVFRIYANEEGNIDIEDADKILFKLNSRLGRNYTEDDLQTFYDALDITDASQITLDEFKNALLSV